MVDGAGERYASLKVVARRAGVSYQTVSKALNGGGAVAPATLRRIQSAAEEVGYVSNALARGLRMRGSETIGIVSADQSDKGLGRFVLAAETQARRQGWATVVANVDAACSDVIRCVGLLSERRVEGILMAAPQAEADPALGERLRECSAVVSLHHIHGLRVALVGSDHVQTGRLAVSHLLAHGRRELGMITSPPGRSVTRARCAGCAAALHEAEEPSELRDRVQEADWTAAGGYRAAHALLYRHPGLDGLFAHDDEMAIGALRALHERGCRVPHDVAVVGCDDGRHAAYTIPSLTTIRIPFDDTGRTAMALLIAVVDGGAPPASSTKLPVELVVRASCGCADPLAMTLTDDDTNQMGTHL